MFASTTELSFFQCIFSTSGCIFQQFIDHNYYCYYYTRTHSCMPVCVCVQLRQTCFCLCTAMNFRFVHFNIHTNLVAMILF